MMQLRISFDLLPKICIKNVHIQTCIPWIVHHSNIAAAVSPEKILFVLCIFALTLLFFLPLQFFRICFSKNFVLSRRTIFQKNCKNYEKSYAKLGWECVRIKFDNESPCNLVIEWKLPYRAKWSMASRTLIFVNASIIPPSAIFGGSRSNHGFKYLLL